MPYLPAARFLALLAATGPLHLLGTGAGIGGAALLLAAAIVDALLVPGSGLTEIRRIAPARVGLGDVAEIAFVLENRSQARLRLRLTDDVPLALRREGADTLDVRVAPGHRAECSYRLFALERGTATLGDIHLRLLGPLGLVWRQRRIRSQDELLVQPGLAEVQRYRKLALHHRTRELGLRSVRHLRGEGTAFESLREYVRGDDPRTVDWKATARRATTMVRQYEAERSQNVMLAIDAGRLMTERIGSRARLDHALSAALLLADVAALNGDRVGAFVFADRVQQYLPPARMPLHRLAEILSRTVARRMEPDYPAAFAYLAHHLRRRTLLVLFTDVIDAQTSAALLAHLRGASRRHLALAVALRNTELERLAVLRPAGDADVFRRAAAEELIQARAGALAAMRRAGILVADTRPEDAVPAVLDRYLEVKKKGLL